jgi:YgiT-type zinc finger domain-containing protein
VPGVTTYTVDLGSGVIVVRDVPAMVCGQCGEEWIGAETARALEGLVEGARRSKRQVEVVTFQAAVTAA